MRFQWMRSVAILAVFGFSPVLAQPKAQPKIESLPGTKPLTMEGDIASQLVAGVDKFLLRELDNSVKGRAKYWKRDFSSAEAYNKSIEPNRKRLAKMLGVVDERVKFDDLELIATTGQKEPGLVGKGEGYNIYAIRWPVLADPHPKRNSVIIHGEGLLLVPTKGKPVADVVAIPHCDHTPEMIVGWENGVPKVSQFARRLAESGCRVIVPSLINRGEAYSKLTWREYLYRSAFEVGRHLIGYEVQKVLACVDWFQRDAAQAKRKTNIGVVGYGDGGMVAFYAGALDGRVETVCVSGYFDVRRNMWQEPIDRNVFGLLTEFGDGETAMMGFMGKFQIENTRFPERVIAGGRGAPSRMTTPPEIRVSNETIRVELELSRRPGTWTGLVLPEHIERGEFLGVGVIEEIVRELNPLVKAPGKEGVTPQYQGIWDPEARNHRHRRQAEEIDRYNQLLLRDCAHARYQTFWKKLDLSSVEKYEKSIEPFRKQFRDEVIGRFELDMLPANARTRKDAETDKWTRYEVVLDVYEDVIAYGLLIVPKGIKEGERRPVVVCQHGLEGRPQDVIGEKSYHYYKAFATSLAERGFVTFAPQNLYIFKDRFRTLQRKANPLGKTLFSVIVPQHQQITDWLKRQPFVDGKRIGFYGLSYGGKSAMRIPPLVDNYCLSICSADFNEWVWKNASTSPFAERYTYANKGEYEIFEWDLGHTFNYAEMAALIAPRPFMVERGHDDGVAPDETVAFEYAKVRRLYAKLGIGDRTEIEFFNGPHSINGKGTFDFLHKHLNWPKSQAKK